MVSNPGEPVPSSGLSVGFLAAGVGFLVLPLSDALAKVLGAEGVPAIQITWGRWISHALLITPLVLVLFGKAALRPHQPVVQLLRGVFLVLASIMFFSGLKIMPLPTMTATVFVAPLIVTALSRIILKELVGPWRWAGVAVGFIGMLLIVRPGADSFQPGSLYALASASSFACYLLLTRRYSGNSSPLITMMWMGLVGTVIMSIAVIPVYQPFEVHQWGILGVMGVLLLLGHGLIIWAAGRLEASAMAPMPYLGIISSTSVGYFAFGEFPVLTTWIGCFLIIAGGIFVAWREHRVGKPNPVHRQMKP